MALSIRAATASDETHWRRLWAGYVAFSGIELAEDIVSLTWSRLIDPAAPLFARLAILDGEPVGFVICQEQLATFFRHPICYIEDLYVDPSARGQGVARAMIDDLIALCQASDWDRLYWYTERDNAVARRLYDRYSATDDHVRYKLTFGTFTGSGKSA
ncbi:MULTISPECIES: GNAT family N-acetyltransferase [Ensifer]|jgi:ribosomal protein S18 acetylase RimI-like enzyme|uniref:GNAT family N-acetyltransferase n=1 Tax=Ensifer TaxID=106591 RepID=UPI00042EB8AD|nr:MULTISPECIES: GNAT family N-acetyltransferase [Ensifer]AHK43084.1 putative acetyltransferase [Ensifer adhaerens OV14]MDP9628806.1 ribosomal protein S18 acetylase RimI-like enzyme [Ensifer adhaerens]KQU98420.1 GNAT family acetyltransferase [Ensifer sp. Root31]KQW85195.1 GNAT family acetyltransferase [Ensifer sp. Root127]MBD9485803.1 GNAT family N-acetyltransferase [Ensifer sp. ENS11]